MTNLQAIRLNRRMSQSQLAKAANVNLRTLQMYEEGYREISHARFDVLLKICMALDCKVDEILKPQFKELHNAYNKKEG